MSGNNEYAKRSISYRQGIAAEAKINEALATYAPLVGRMPQESTQHENKVLDIDYWWGNIPISNKFMRSADKWGSMTFELEVFHVSQYGDDSYEFTDYRDGKHYEFTGNWKRSWFFNGKALYFAVMTESKAVYMVNKEALTRYVERNGWTREAELSITHRVAQAKMFHPHVTAKLGIMDIKTMLEEGIAWRVR